MLTEKEITKIIDHTNIKREADLASIVNSCQEAKEFGFRGLCVNSQWVKTVKKELKGTDIKVICLIDPPMGISPHELRIQQCQKAKIDGADEIDVVINVIDMKYERYINILNDLKEICLILPTKVIIGSGYLTNNEVEKASQLVKEAGAICVKTATERDPLGHSELIEKAKHLVIMKEAAPGLLIKAAGGIKGIEDLEMMVNAGADIIGTSYGVKIVKEAKARE
ncbi:MAG: deoxyribose-phosphate aldolase [Parcubacteria group bacterium CG10_big_fil_rev_8_21_14_0_10_35_15]|nr:MAG: deoxyribose-phosphate aldolase [Parcubacteria group bacterium CG10_big_fil_rev_8_21_14_0_10_35_15]